MKLYGSVEYMPEQRAWRIECQPHVAIKLKRVFAKIDIGTYDAHRLSDTRENAKDLEWYLTRYPMAISPEDAARLRAGAAEYEETVAVTDALMAGRAPPPDVDLAIPLRDYQKQAVAMQHKLRRLLIGDDLGLGKSAEAIGLFTEKGALPGLVVTMTHLPQQWKSEINRFAPALSVEIVRKTTPYSVFVRGKRDEPKRMPDILVMSYTKLAGWAETLAGVVRGVVFDEAQELRIHTSDKYKAASHISRSAGYVTGLTATPVYNMGSEFHSVMDAIKPDCLGTRAEFLREWCRAGEREGKESIKNPKAFGQYVRDAGLMIRRTRAQVGRELPAVSKIPHYVDADVAALDKVSDGCRELALFILGQGGTPLQRTGDHRADLMNASEQLSNRLRQATGIAKAPYVADFVRMLIESGEQVVLFGWHRAVYAVWQDKLKDVPHALYTGTESSVEKEKAKRLFLDRKISLLIMSLRAGAGLDGLQSVCRTVCFGELDWAFGVHEQNIGRVHRDGQKEPVAAYFLVSEVGADPIMIDTLGIKRDQLSGIIDPKRDIVETAQADPDRIRKLAADYLAQRGVAGRGVRVA